MATLITPPTNKLIYPPSQLWRISVDRYHEMIEAGLLTENDRLELLEGFLIEKMTIKPPHTHQKTDEIPVILNGQEITRLKVSDLLP